MTIETELTTLNATKQAIKTAIENQGKSLDGKNFGEYAPEISAIPSCNALVESGAMAAAFRNDSTPVQTDTGDWLLLADKQPSYGDVRPEQPEVVEQGDGTTGYRDTGVIPPQEGYVEVEFIHVAAAGLSMLTGAQWVGGNQDFLMIYVDTDTLHVYFNGPTITHTLTVGERYVVRMAYTAATINVRVNDVLIGSAAKGSLPPDQSLYLHARNILGSPSLFSKEKLISVEIGDANGTPLHRWTASNMYYDQIGNAAAVAHGTLTQLSDPLGDQTFNERGYRVNGNELIPAKLDGTAAADGQPLTYSGRAPHSVLLPSYSGSGPITNELMQFTDDGPLDQYLAGSGTENGQQFTFADVTNTANVITTSNGFSVWKTAPSVQSILEEICK